MTHLMFPSGESSSSPSCAPVTALTNRILPTLHIYSCDSPPALESKLPFTYHYCKLMIIHEYVLALFSCVKGSLHPTSVVLVNAYKCKGALTDVTWGPLCVTMPGVFDVHKHHNTTLLGTVVVAKGGQSQNQPINHQSYLLDDFLSFECTTQSHMGPHPLAVSLCHVSAFKHAAVCFVQYLLLLIFAAICCNLLFCMRLQSVHWHQRLPCAHCLACR